MDVKEALRWFVRRDSEAGATMLGGLLQSLQGPVSTIVGVGDGIIPGLAVFAGFFVVKCISGYIDLHIIGATAYRNHYISDKAPLNVRLAGQPVVSGRSELNDMQDLRQGKDSGPEESK